MDIQFGDVEEAGREVKLRPDQNRHYAVVAVHQPESEDLPIFVDIDVMRDMESHALTDTSVELGGVMLGGQFEDEDGQPFVVVTDSLRAEHYEATKGSFKFTHETWQKISRQRDEFPPELQMVGWYHTHPDWGVFLSGMDDFICQNFFNRPLDLALVIDPCRGDRGWFQWMPDSYDRTRRTGGFYLIGSRFRHAEIEFFAFQLRGKLEMTADYRGSQVAGSIGPSSAPVVNISDRRDNNPNLGMLGLLAMQFLFLALISWKLLFSEDKKEAIADLKKEMTAKTEKTVNEQRIKILEKALTLSGDKAELAALMEENSKLEIQVEDSAAKRIQLSDENKSLNAKFKIKDAENATLKRDLAKKKDDVVKLKSRVKELEDADGEDETPFWKNGTLILFVAATGFLCGIAGGTVGFLMGRVNGENRDDFDEPDPVPFEIQDEPEQPSKEISMGSESVDEEQQSSE